jgi:hypothetical protein
MEPSWPAAQVLPHYDEWSPQGYLSVSTGKERQKENLGLKKEKGKEKEKEKEKEMVGSRRRRGAGCLCWGGSCSLGRLRLQSLPTLATPS